MILLAWPVETVAHGWPAGVKLALLCLLTTVLFGVDDVYVLAGACLGVLGLYAVPGWHFLCAGVVGLRVLVPFFVVVALWHGFAGTFGEGAVVILRLIAVLACANLVTMTTRLSDMIEVVSWLATPLRKIGVHTKPVEIAIALVVRMIPTLVSRATMLAGSWKARSLRGPGWQMVLPIVLVTLDDAEHVASALRARGGIGGPGGGADEQSGR